MDITVGAGGKGVAYAFLKGTGRELFRIEGALSTPMKVPTNSSPSNAGHNQFATDDEGGLHSCVVPFGGGERRIIYREYRGGSWVEESHEASQAASCALWPGVGRVMLVDVGGGFLRRDGAEVVRLRNPVGNNYNSEPRATILDARGVALMVDGGLLYSSLPDEPTVRIGSIVGDNGLNAARVPGVSLPALVASRPWLVAYPTASGYIQIRSPAEGVYGDPCHVCGYEGLEFGKFGNGAPECHDVGVRASAAKLATASGVLWLAWVQAEVDRRIVYPSRQEQDARYRCDVDIFDDRGHTEIVLARVTEAGVEVKRRLPVPNPKFALQLGMRAIDEYLVIGAGPPSRESQESNGTDLEVFVVDTSRL
ncbi:MAG TPA: hypothetical protein PLR99_20660 [Polyangiaceae bacterium]|nr:hypothetical protein [Polyangiaceae bacterium]